jgi:GAF domain-containing protein
MHLMPQDLLASLIAAANATAAALEPAGHDDLLQAVVDAARELFGAAACSLALVDGDTDEVVYRVASGAGAVEVVGLRLPLGRGVAGWVVASGMPIAIDDVAADPRFGKELAEQTGYVPRSILATPLETDQAVLGVLSVLDRGLPEGAAAAQREMALLGLFARQAAYAIDAARVHRSVGRTVLAALREAAGGEDVVALLARASEAAPASDRLVADLAGLFARLGRADPDLVRVAGGVVEDLVAYAERKARL